MSTVNCPNCNKLNIEGSKFCNSCGSALPPSTHIACPNCGTRNPKNLLYCDNCGTRLLATGELSSRREEEKEPEAETRTPRAFSLPTREPGDELEEDNLLDWLRTGEEHAEESAPASDTVQESNLEEWFSDLSDVDAAEAEDEPLTDWFEDTDQAQEDSVSADLDNWFSESEETLIEEGGLADWLSELEEDDETEETAEPPAFDETTPDWLDELEEEGSQETIEEQTFTDWLNDLNLEAEADQPETEIDIDDTLIAASPYQEADEELPEWFNNGGDKEKGDRPVEELAQWLSEFEDEEGTPTLIESVPGQEDDDDLPEWLSNLEDQPPVVRSEEVSEDAELPEWFSEDSVDDTPTMITAAPEEEPDEALPDWLEESLDEAETLVSETAADESMPDWLAETAEEEEQLSFVESGEATEDEGDLPDWLSEYATERANTTELREVLSEMDEDEPAPDWLSDLIPGQEPAVTETAEQESLTDWFSDLDDEMESPAGEEPFAETAEEEAVSDWLSDFGFSEEDEEVSPVGPEESDEDSWLDDIFEEEPALEDTIVSMTGDAPEAEAEEEEELEADLPDWLSEMPSYDTRILPETEGEGAETDDIFAEFSDAELSPMDEMPDWLADVASAVEPVEELTESVEEPEDDSLPDWLSDLPDEVEDTFDEDDDTDWLAALTLDEPWPETAEDEEIAAQIDELGTVVHDPSGPSQELHGVPKELVGSELPDWLQEDMPRSERRPQQDLEEDIFGLGSEELAPGELPEWLQQMKPAETRTPAGDEELDFDFSSVETQDEWQGVLEQMPGSPGSIPGVAELNSAEIPAWLQALKPRDFSDEDDDLPASDEHPEAKGPLTGLRGVLQIAAVVTEPVAAKTPAPYTISKEQQQQIALLHRLTHEEPEAIKQVAVKKAATFSTPWRAVLGTLLLLVVLAGVILPRTGIGLPETALPVPNSALNTFETMNQVTGRSVLVAFDYTPAMAGELDPIALMLMRQLADNGNRVVTISQSPVGTAIADQLVDEVGTLQGRALPILTGEAVGLRSLAACLSNTAENCDPLYDSANPELMADLSNIGLVIVLTSDRNSLVNWIEQVESEIDAPFIAAVTQPLGPLTVPYVSSKQLDGTLNGIPAASAYEKRLRGQDGSAFQQFTAQTIVMWVVIISLIVAAVVYGTAGLAENRTKKDSE